MGWARVGGEDDPDDKSSKTLAIHDLHPQRMTAHAVIENGCTPSMGD